MTLQCECGGVVEIQSQSYGDTSAVETYKCLSCGRTGTFRFGDGTSSKTGCLTENGSY